MVKTVYGIVHGRTIELDEDLGVADGQNVEVQVKVLAGRKKLPGPPAGWQPGSTATGAGMLANSWSEDDDRALAAIHDERKRSSRPERGE